MTRTETNTLLQTHLGTITPLHLQVQFRRGNADGDGPTIPRTPSFCSSTKTAQGKLVRK